MKRKEQIIYSTGLLLVMVIAYLISQTVFGIRLQRIFSDRARDIHARSEVVVVGVDDASLQTLGAWPWKRDLFAQAIDRLEKEGARVVVFDLLFLEKRDGDKEVEVVLLQSKKNVLFASKLDDTGAEVKSVYSTTPYALHALAHVYPNDDGKVREAYFFLRDKDGNCIPTLSYAAYLTYTKKDINVCDTSPHSFLYQQDNSKPISFKDVVEGKPLPDIHNKIVLIGSVTLDLEDHFVSLSGEKIAGVFVHRSMLTSMLNDSFPKKIGITYTLLLLLLIALYGTYIALRLQKVFLQIILILIGILAVVAFGFMNYAYVYPFGLLTTSLLFTSVYGFMFRYRTTEKKNEHIRNLFGKYVHKDVLKKLLESGQEVKLGGEKRDVTVLFSDIRGFTSFSEIMSPEELTGLLNGYLSAMSPQILEEKGTIDKFIGDAIMAFWNAPLSIPNHTLHAVKSALRMEEALTVFNKKHNTSLAIGIGLHAGEVVVGNVGSQDRINYTILGDVVNTGSRLEGLTKKYGVFTLTSEEVRSRVQDPHITFRKLDVITVKGKSEPTTVYEVRRTSNFARHVVSDYELGLMSYVKGDFDKALIIFRKLAQEGDMPSLKMVERIPTIDRTTWDGVWRFDEK